MICESVKPFGGTMECHNNQQILDLQLRNRLLQDALNEGEPLLLQAADRIEELESEVTLLRDEVQRLLRTYENI